ncbi:conserved hypothetical protein, membrane [Candidatus Magnetobacterium bavaricum]|uniref:Uncharacterized protein n=1 Tax=Candidatus Magnetobacterium bavaricum TaxID=29290 RepID=A0A0F3GMY5_9BACT|nr:conserved hypothetical protein, membrane [Candidatus Magnetobacterium bavaricum]
MKSMSFLMYFGNSSKSFSLRFGTMILFMPIRLAARVFSLSPPMGSTVPLSVTSPVMAMFLLTGMPVSADAIAVVIVIPADGPSLGMAPAGTCMWMSRLENSSSSIFKSFALERTYDRAAWADSFITSPSCPVMVRLPLPFIVMASTYIISPPLSVHAKPVETPTSSFLISSSGKNLGAPRNFTIFFGVAETFLSLPSAIWRATFRHSSAIERSRFLTPASRVYWVIIRCRAASVRLIISVVRPCSSNCLGMR